MQSSLIGPVIGAIVLGVLGLYVFGTWGGVIGALAGVFLGEKLHVAW